MVEKKDKILEQLGDKRVVITIKKTKKNLRKMLAKYNFQEQKNKLIFSLDLKNNRNSVSDLFKDLIKNSISFYDIEIKKNNLEEIFLKLVDQ
jgi:ABC-type multidrug transport system ATPase subunit